MSGSLDLEHLTAINERTRRDIFRLTFRFKTKPKCRSLTKRIRRSKRDLVRDTNRGSANRHREAGRWESVEGSTYDATTLPRLLYLTQNDDQKKNLRLVVSISRRCAFCYREITKFSHKYTNSVYLITKSITKKGVNTKRESDNRSSILLKYIYI